MEDIAGVDLQFRSLEDLAVRCLSNAGQQILLGCRLIAGAVAVLAIPAVLLCALVFALSVFLRDDGLTHGFPTNDPLMLVAAAPMHGTPQSNKAGRLTVAASSHKLTSDSILAAYRRTVVSPYAQQNVAALFAMATHSDAQNALAVEAALIPAAPVVAEAEKPLPLPIARPAYDLKRVASLTQAPHKPATPTPAEAPKAAPAPAAAPQAPLQYAALPEASEPAVNPGVLSRRTAPDARAIPWPGRNDRTAIYDISAGVVYLPNGEKLEAHSGVGHMRDNPSYVRVKMLGPTPPATYSLSMREAIFHGVAAIRLTPVNGVAPFGREGLLAHTYMLRNPGDSNGCVVFADYNKFLKAFRNNEIGYITVVAHVEDRMT